MFKLFNRALFLVLAMLFVSIGSSAQDLPIDPAVRIGHLPNGLTYYIRHNETPKGQADFYIAQKVGSILEEDNQRGLAHFLEHMCFNGTTNFPGNSLINWLETKGVKFGANLNAYTDVDETVYNISNVPVANQAVQDSCLLILHDWANDLLLDPEEIDKERGVIHQEWRTTNKGTMRILESLLPVIYQGNKYGYRLPIGTMEVVDNFPPQALRDYYETWYRPDQQGIIVVGDIDVDYIEGKIKEMFSSIEMPENPKPREYTEVDDNEGTIFAIASDPEQTIGLLEMSFKTDPFPNESKTNPMYLMVDFANDMVVQMLDQRLNDIAMTPESPFASAGVGYGKFLASKTKDALTLDVSAKGDDVLPGFEAAYRELLRARDGGFTETEYERAKADYLSRLEAAYNSRDSRESETFSKAYVRNFIDNEPIMSAEDKYAVMNAMINNVPLELINSILPDLVTDDNRVILVAAPQNDTFHLPSPQEITEVIAKVDAEDIQPYEDAVKAEPLIPELPTPGKVVSVVDNAQWDAKEIMLSNGVKVLVKPTDFKKDEIIFYAQAIGGTSDLGAEYDNTLVALPIFIDMMSLGDYTNKDLGRYLKGKRANGSVALNDYDREVSGFSTVKDLPTLMELIYMTFTAYNLDQQEYLAAQKQIEAAFANIESNPEYVFQKTLNADLYKSPAKAFMSLEAISPVKSEDIVSVVRNQLANAADFTFYFVGDVNVDSITPLLEQYIATLSADAAKATKTYTPNPDMEIRKGASTDISTMKMETPQTYVAIVINGTLDYTPTNRLVSSIAGQILSNRLLHKIREEMGAVYSIGAAANMTRTGLSNTTVQIPFPMKPELRDEVLNEISTMINDMAENIAADELDPIKEYMVKNYTEQKEKNEGWASAMAATQLNGVDFFNGVIDYVNAITTDDVKAFMKQLLDQGNYHVVVLDPEQ